MSYNYHLNTHEDMIQNSIIDLILFIVMTQFRAQFMTQFRAIEITKLLRMYFQKLDIKYITNYHSSRLLIEFSIR